MQLIVCCLTVPNAVSCSWYPVLDSRVLFQTCIDVLIKTFSLIPYTPFILQTTSRPSTSGRRPTQQYGTRERPGQILQRWWSWTPLWNRLLPRNWGSWRRRSAPKTRRTRVVTKAYSTHHMLQPLQSVHLIFFIIGTRQWCSLCDTQVQTSVYKAHFWRGP